MKRIFDHLRSYHHRLLGLEYGKIPDLNWLRRTQWCPEFEQLCRNRMVLGAIRYGLLGAKDKPQYDRISDIKRRADLYTITGNLEFLVDLANLAMCEYVEGKHPRKHFKSHDDGGHTRTIKEI